MTQAKENSIQLDALMPVIRERLSGGQSVRFSPKGTSMLPLLRQNVDSVVLSPLPETLKKYDLPLYQRDNGQYVLHRIVRTGETYTCVGDNQFDLEKGLREDQMIALVTAVYRGEKKIPVTAFGYRCYCRLWHYSRFPRHCWRSLRNRVRRILS